MNTSRLTDDELAARIHRGFARFDPAPSTTLPVTSPRRGRGRLMALLALPAGAVVIALLVNQVAAPASAFASWSAIPTAPDPTVVASMLEICRAPISPDMPADERAYLEELYALPMVTVDQRGTAAVALFAERRPGGIAEMLCLGAADSSGTLTTAGSGGGLGGQETPASGPLRLITRTSIWSYGGEALTAAAGSVEPGVEKVVVSRASGGDVTATIEGGFWLAWWPGVSEMLGATALGADGSEVARINP